MGKRVPIGIRLLQVAMIVLAILLLAFVIWRATLNLTPESDNQAPINQNDTNQNNQTSEPDNTTTYSSEVIGITLKYPKNWKKVECPQRDTAVYFGTDDRGVGIENGTSIICGGGSDFPPQMTISRHEEQDYQGSATPVDVTIDGIESKKYREIENGVGLYPKGFETISYYIPMDGTTLIATYSKWPSDYAESYDTSEESLKQFEDLVENDLKITQQ